MISALVKPIREHGGLNPNLIGLLVGIFGLWIIGPLINYAPPARDVLLSIAGQIDVEQTVLQARKSNAAKDRAVAQLVEYRDYLGVMAGSKIDTCLVDVAVLLRAHATQLILSQETKAGPIELRILEEAPSSIEARRRLDRCAKRA